MVSGAMITLVAGCVTVTSHVSVLLLPSVVVTVIVVVPLATPLTTPVVMFTVATFVLLLLHVTPLFGVVSGKTTTSRDRVSPMIKETVLGVTATSVASCKPFTARSAELLEFVSEKTLTLNSLSRLDIISSFSSCLMYTSNSMVSPGLMEYRSFKITAFCSLKNLGTVRVAVL